MNYNKDTKIIFSISQTPGNFGTQFHNHLYHLLNINFFYKACPCHSLEDAIKGMRSLNIHGLSVSMPFKQKILPFLDSLDESANEAGAVNTILNEGPNGLKGFNTDLYALKTILSQYLPQIENVLIVGNGAIAQMAINFLKNKNIYILTRGDEQFQKLQQLKPSVLKIKDKVNYQLVINATPQLITNIPMEQDILKNSTYILDYPVINNVTYKATHGQKYISGLEITKLQAKKQFEIYTGRSLQEDQIESAFSAIKS